MTSWFSNQGSVLIALNQEVKSCFHVRHAESTYTFGARLNTNNNNNNNNNNNTM